MKSALVLQSLPELDAFGAYSGRGERIDDQEAHNRRPEAYEYLLFHETHLTSDGSQAIRETAEERDRPKSRGKTSLRCTFGLCLTAISVLHQVAENHTGCPGRCRS